MLVELSRFKTRRSRALADLSIRALRWSLGGAIGAWGATAQSAGASGPDEPVITGERTPGPAAAAAAGDAALAAGRADRTGQAGAFEELQAAGAVAVQILQARAAR